MVFLLINMSTNSTTPQPHSSLRDTEGAQALKSDGAACVIGVFLQST